MIKEFKGQGEKSFPGSGYLKPCNRKAYCLRKDLLKMSDYREIYGSPRIPAELKRWQD
jgi:hypothetical protein